MKSGKIRQAKSVNEQRDLARSTRSDKVHIVVTYWSTTYYSLSSYAEIEKETEKFQLFARNTAVY
jgi:hypothetical protein